ncbi:MAG TPA: DUF1080 domain-containing protein [Bryobacteraceae bacterium]|nr:DUF1080 domain-containing protein [Bryobacteraceae bacterium]
MLRSAGLVVLTAFLLPALLPAANSPFVGRWDFNVTEANGKPAANWLGIKDKGDGLDIWFQPTGGHVFQVTNYKVNGSHLTLTMPHALSWDLDAADGKLTGTQKHGDDNVALTGVRAPELDNTPPKAWTTPRKLFNGKNLDGWHPVGDVANNHWVVQDGDLLNEKHGANLESDEKFTNYKLHFEVNCPDDANSGFYQRGRYELQLEYEKEGTEPPERAMGAIYGRIAPSVTLPRKVGQWESFDVTLVGRMITVSRDGTLTIDHKEIEGITGGALDANEGEPGSFYIQGDHTGGLRFRNITVAVPKE